MFGITPCGGSEIVSVPTGYVVWTSYKVAANSQANCITGATWIFSDRDMDISRAGWFTDSAEDWKNGTRLDTTQATYGVQPLIIVVGGVNANMSYGMGRWN